MKMSNDAMFKENDFYVKIKSKTSNDILTLKFLLLDNNLVSKWLNLVKSSNDKNLDLTFNYRKIPSQADLKNDFEEFRTNIKTINSYYDRELTDIQDIEWLRSNDHVLNDLHEEYEVYGDRMAALLEAKYYDNPNQSEFFKQPFPGTIFNKDLHNRMLRLNEQIHNFESIFKSWDSLDETLCSCLVDWLPAGLHEDLAPEDYFLFTPDFLWGWTYLGYNTLGKHWASMYIDDDIEVVKRNQVRPQQRFAAEFYMCFRDNQPYLNNTLFHKWWRSRNVSDITSAEMKLRDYAFGFIPLARIKEYKINDGDFIRVPMRTTNEYIKNWNKNVWSKFDIITYAGSDVNG
jgi:hypothetical protein